MRHKPDSLDLLIEHMRANKAKQKPRKPKKPDIAAHNWAAITHGTLLALPTGREITADDLAMMVGKPPKGNSFGGVFQQASKHGILTDTGNTVVSSKAEARGRRIRVWRRA